MRSALLLALAVSSASCGSKPRALPTTPPPAAAPAATPAAAVPPVAAAPRFANVPEGLVGDQLSWVLGTLKAGKVEAADVEAHFHASFLAQVPTAQVVAITAELGKEFAGFEIVDAKPAGALALVARAKVGDKMWRISIALDPDNHRIAGLRFQPDMDMSAKPASFEDAEKMLVALAPKARMLVAEVVNGTCKPIRQVAAKDQLAIGSTFKLYVLLAVVDQILAGKLSWTDELAVRDDWKSLPSGVTQNDAAGTKLSVQVFAERMISISDNTATDHLLRTVGRDRVEAAVRSAKHGKPALDIPFLTTRDMFVLKLGLSAEERAKYLAMPAAKRKAYLDKTVATAPLPGIENAETWKTAKMIDKLEWFASGEDLCRVMATLAARATKPKAALLRSVLSKNPGLPIDPKVWPFIGFKGGSEPGVMDLTYWLERDDKRTFVVTVAVNSGEGGTVDEEKTAALVTGVIEVLGKSLR
jgi:beta-lactamase class A